MFSEITHEGTFILDIPLRLILGSILLIAGIEKLRNLSAFVAGVNQYKILPIPIAHWYGHLLPFIELGAGVLLFSGLLLRFAALLSAAMFASFALAVTINLHRKREMPCYCFGTETKDNMGWHTLARIILLLLYSLAILINPSNTDPLRNWIINPSLIGAVEIFPLLALSVAGLVLLSLIEISPYILRAWTAPAIRPNRRKVSAVWAREPDSLDKGAAG